MLWSYSKKFTRHCRPYGLCILVYNYLSWDLTIVQVMPLCHLSKSSPTLQVGSLVSWDGIFAVPPCVMLHRCQRGGKLCVHTHDTLAAFETKYHVRYRTLLANGQVKDHHLKLLQVSVCAFPNTKTSGAYPLRRLLEFLAWMHHHND